MSEILLDHNDLIKVVEAINPEKAQALRYAPYNNGFNGWIKATRLQKVLHGSLHYVSTPHGYEYWYSLNIDLKRLEREVFKG